MKIKELIWLLEEQDQEKDIYRYELGGDDYGRTWSDFWDIVGVKIIEGNVCLMED